MNKNKIEIYTGPNCSFCILAKNLLIKKSINFKEIHLSKFPEKREEMLKRSNGKHTIPQTFINNKHIGGYYELNKLEITGELNKILKE